MLRELNEQLERAKDLLKQSFERYVSAQIVDEVLQSSQPVNLRGERKKVTILLSDIRGFTPLSEQGDSQHEQPVPAGVASSRGPGMAT